MIQEIISVIVDALLRRKKCRREEWTEYDGLSRQILGFPTSRLADMDMQELTDRYKGDPNEMQKLELAAITMLRLSDEMEADHLLRKSKLRQDGLALLKHVQKEGGKFLHTARTAQSNCWRQMDKGGGKRPMAYGRISPCRL